MLYILLCVEFVLRVWLEVREARLTLCRGGVFALLRIIPLVNDLTPLPENRKDPEKNSFTEKHEEGHGYLHHTLLRNLFKVIMLILAVWFFSFQIIRNGCTLWESILWLHLVAIPGRIIFHLYCWNQEFEADRYAHKELGKTKTKAAMHALSESEIPYTRLFALIYREHPTASMRSKKMLHKEFKAKA